MKIRKLKDCTVVCTGCGSELTFEVSDIELKEVDRTSLSSGPWKETWGYITCPECNKSIHVRYEKGFCDKVKFNY